MIVRSPRLLSLSTKVRIPHAHAHAHAHAPRSFLTGSSAPSHSNRIFDNVRTPNDLHTLTMLSAADNRPLITLWSAGWCTTCQAVKPLVKRMLEEEHVGEEEGGLGFAEVELDSTLIGDLGVKYMVGRPMLMLWRCNGSWAACRLLPCPRCSHSADKKPNSIRKSRSPRSCGTKTS